MNDIDLDVLSGTHYGTIDDLINQPQFNTMRNTVAAVTTDTTTTIRTASDSNSTISIENNDDYTNGEDIDDENIDDENRLKLYGAKGFWSRLVPWIKFSVATCIPFLLFIWLLFQGIQGILNSDSDLISSVSQPNVIVETATGRVMLASDNQFHGNIYSEYWYLYGACVAFLTIVLAISTSSFIKNFSTEMEAFRNECNVFVNIGSYPGLCSYLISIISIFFISYSLSDLLFGNPGLLFLLLIVVWLFTCYLLSNFISN